MISNNELLDLVKRIEDKGAAVNVTYDDALMADEGRKVIDTVQVSGVKGIGPYPMAPIAAAEAIRDALSAILAYESRMGVKQERLEDRADRLRKEGNTRVKTGRDAMALIPFGQPILVGHYSENRDRNYRNKAWNNMGKGYELQKQADEVAARAASVGSGGISSDDPTAVAQLREKVAKLEERQATMTAVNKLVGKDDKAALAAMGYSETRIENLFTPQWGNGRGPIGYPPYELTNNNANIRRIKERIAYLEKNATVETKETKTDSGVRIVENADINRLQLFFPGKPSAEIRTELKSCGFRWSPTEGAWQRHLGTNAKWAAEQIVKKLAPEDAA